MISESAPISEAVEVFFKAAGTEASGLFQDGKITVRAGSRGRATDSPSLDRGSRQHRQKLIDDGVVTVEGDRMVFNSDYVFSSPWAASTVLLGRSGNGWRLWATADGQLIRTIRSAPVLLREREYDQRWYEAHVQRFNVDTEAVAHWAAVQQVRDTDGAGALALLDALRANRNVQQFVTGLQAWAPTADDGGFNGFSGQMTVNLLLKQSDNEIELADLLADVLAAPNDVDEARQKIERLVDYIETIRVGAHPAPGNVPFLVSYFWALQDHERWPVIWASVSGFAIFLRGEALPASPADRYLAVCEIVENVAESNEQFEHVSAWWDDTKPVLLDPVLVDRAQFGLDYGLNLDARQRNATFLVSVADHIAKHLREPVSVAVGRELIGVKPPKGWAEKTPRADLWADWRAFDNGPAIRLWLTHAGLAIGLVPGLVNAGWLAQATPIIEQAQLRGFERINARGGRDGAESRIVAGRNGEFIYARWYEPAQLAGLDVRNALTGAADALRQVMDELVRLHENTTQASAKDPLHSFVERFQSEHPPTTADDSAESDRVVFAEFLANDRVAFTDVMDLRTIWNTRRWGDARAAPSLDRAIRDAAPAEYDRIISSLKYLCWGDEPDSVRIDRLLDDPDYSVPGLGESTIMKMLSICHPDRYLPVFAYSGPSGKREMLHALALDEPSGTRGQIQVQANDSLRERLGPFFPNQPWRAMRFLYWYLQAATEPEPTRELSELLDELAEEALIDRDFLDDIVALLEDKGQVVFYGPPGTGKTYLARRLAEVLAADSSRRSLVQFHPSTSYEDFFEGYRPENGTDGTLTYRLTRGPLALIAQRANESPTKRHMMVIDELNRANLPRVFGELLFLLEYRDESVRTLYRPDDTFELPSNLWFIGTMNTADRSIALVDAALRRRFNFIPFFPNVGPMAGLLERWLERTGGPTWVGELVAMVNDTLETALGGPHLQIGPSYFMKRHLDETSVRRIWEYNIEPFIEDQFFGDADQIDAFRFERVLRSYLQSVDANSLEHLARMRAADAGASPKSTAGMRGGPDLAESEFEVESDADVVISDPDGS